MKSCIQQILAVVFFLWSLVRTPVLFIGATIANLFAWYKKLWIKYTHNKYEEFVYKRGVAMTVATVASLIIIPTIALLIFQTSYYLATNKKDTIYLIQSEEIYPDDNIWGVRGCYSKDCDSNTSLYFRIKPSLFHHLWNIGHNGNLFLPDIIASSVPTGLTQCEVTSYGLRARVLMTFHIYPSILEIQCGGSGDLAE